MKTPNLTVRPRVQPVTLDATVRLGVAGGITVTKRNRDGRRVPVRVDRTKRAWQRVWEHRQPNLITNSGLDRLGTGALEGLAQAIAVGTGSTAPDPTDTGLVSELARTSSVLTIAVDKTWSHPSTGKQVVVRGRAFDFGEANGNLTEFGGFLSTSGGNAFTRELFRDEANDPTVITKTSDEQLVIDYALELTYEPTSMTAVDDITIDGVGTIELDHMFYRGFGSESQWNLTRRSWHLYRLAPLSAVGSTYNVNEAGTIASGGNIANAASNAGSGQTVAAYVGDSYELVYTAEQAAMTSDYDCAGFILRNFTSTAAARFAVCAWDFTDPSTFTKDKDYKLTLNAKLLWDRA